MNDESIPLTVKLLKSFYPELKSFIRLIQKGNGHLNLPTQFIDAMNQEGLPPWSSFYEDRDRLHALLPYALLGHKDATALQERVINGVRVKIQ
jgi:hypothetical protein